MDFTCGSIFKRHFIIILSDFNMSVFYNCPIWTAHCFSSQLIDPIPESKSTRSFAESIGAPHPCPSLTPPLPSGRHNGTSPSLPRRGRSVRSCSSAGRRQESAVPPRCRRRRCRYQRSIPQGLRSGTVSRQAGAGGGAGLTVLWTSPAHCG